MTAVEPIDLIRKNLELAKEQLKNVDEDIRRITGRDPTDDRFQRRIPGSYKRFESNNTFTVPVQNPATTVVPKDETTKIPEEDLHVSIASSVVRVAENRSRTDAVKDMRKSDKDRGRRMLGILQGTLNQFRAESAAAVCKPQMAKRMQIDKKLEARAEEERQKLRRERAKLFRARREQQIEVALLQQKMRLLKGFETWKTEMEKMIGFCRTETSPHIFFRPKIHNEESRRRTDETADVIQKLIQRRRQKIELGLEENAAIRRRQLASQFTRDSDSDTDDFPNNQDKQSWRRASGKESADSMQMGSVIKKVMPPAKRRRTSGTPTETGNHSDASETFAIEGVEEPVLMEEEHPSTHSNFKANNLGSPVSNHHGIKRSNDFLPTRSDTRSVRIEEHLVDDEPMMDMNL